MYLRRDECTRTVRAPAKLNVYLDVLGQRGDGFHELETLIVPIRLWDSLSLTSLPLESDGRPGRIVLDTLSYLPDRSREPVELPPAGKSNLVLRALELLRERSGTFLGARVELVKRIPMAAGLGGGSSDAAAALALANRAWRLGWDRERLAEVAAELGSDVPFFLHGGAAICRGRGEQIEPLRGIVPLHLVVAKPRHGLSTAAVYRAHQSLPSSHEQSSGLQLDALVLALRRGRVNSAARWMVNRLQAAAATLSPWVDQVRAIFGRLGCLAHQLSGSGSAYFGICRSAQHARRVAAILKAQQLGFVYATRSY